MMSDKQKRKVIFVCVRVGDRTTCTMTQYHSQSHYPDMEQTNTSCTVLILLSARLGHE